MWYISRVMIKIYHIAGTLSRSSTTFLDIQMNICGRCSMKRRKWWKALLCLLLALVLAAGGYAAYVLLAYYRVRITRRWRLPTVAFL